jgi:hypothetical protein
MSTETINVRTVGITLSERREIMNNHTPGPWEVCGHKHMNNDLWLTVLNGAWDITHNKEPHVIASSKYSAMKPEENRANAYLIAASPELLEACIKAYEALDAILDFRDQGLKVQGWHLNGDAEPFDNFINENMQGNEIELLYKAIQKAMGKTHEKG